MNFTIEQKDRAAIFRPQEARLDSMLAPELKAEFLILAQPDVETLVIDLTDVQYIDSAGLSALLLARRQQTSHDGDVRLVGVSDDVRSLLELTQLNRVFPIYDTPQQAIDAPSLSAIVVPADDIDSTTSALGSGMKAAAVGAGVVALGAIALGGDEDLDDDEEYDDDEDFDDDEYDDDDDAEEGEEETEDGEESEDGDEEEDDVEDDDFEFEDDLEFDEDDDDEEDF
ncbi:MAG: STAS domain-containing protein [Bacteroidetes bacterium]|nr:STAS domain-containing protein [Bacteroidota bacterium]